MWGESTLAKVACAGSLAPRAVNDDYVTPELICSTAHARKQLLAVSHAAFVRLAGRSFPVKALADVHWSMRLCFGNVMVMSWLRLQLLHQPGERLGSGRHASWERTHVSAVPLAPRGFFPPLGSPFACAGSSEQCRQCEQQHSWWCEQECT